MFSKAQSNMKHTIKYLIKIINLVSKYTGYSSHVWHFNGIGVVYLFEGRKWEINERCWSYDISS